MYYCSRADWEVVQPFWYVNSILRMFVFLLVAYSLQLDSCKWTKWSACASRDRALCSAEAVLEVIKYPRETTLLVTRTHICVYMTSHAEVRCGTVLYAWVFTRPPSYSQHLISGECCHDSVIRSEL